MRKCCVYSTAIIPMVSAFVFLCPTLNSNLLATVPQGGTCRAPHAVSSSHQGDCHPCTEISSSGLRLSQHPQTHCPQPLTSLEVLRSTLEWSTQLQSRLPRSNQHSDFGPFACVSYWSRYSLTHYPAGAATSGNIKREVYRWFELP